MKKAAVSSILVVVVLLALGVIAEAQQPKKVARICFLGASNASTEAIYVKPFRERLREIGYVEEQNFTIEYRFSEGKVNRAARPRRRASPSQLRRYRYHWD